MRNPQKGLTIPMWLKTLRSMFVGKSFHYFCCLDTLLNKRTELISKCRHRYKFLWANVMK